MSTLWLDARRQLNLYVRIRAEQIIGGILALLIGLAFAAPIAFLGWYVHGSAPPILYVGSILLLFAVGWLGEIFFDFSGFERRRKQRRLQVAFDQVTTPLRKNASPPHNFDFDPKLAAVLLKPRCAIALDVTRGLVRFVPPVIYTLKPEAFEPGHFGEIKGITFNNIEETAEPVDLPPTILIEPAKEGAAMLELIFESKDRPIAKQWARALTYHRDRFFRDD